MNDAQRLGIFGVFLVGLWIVTYWLTDRPGTLTSQSVSFGEPPASLEVELPVEPAPSPEPVLQPTPFARLPEPIAEPPAAPAPGTVIPPSYRIYKIQKGDTAPIISRRFYGTDAHWRAVQWANPLTDFSKLKVGREIRVPVDPQNVEGLVAADPNAPPESKPAQPAAKPPEYVEYIVETGDTLTGIARALYGKTKYWTILRDANKDQVDEEGRNLRKGMVLKVPPLPAGAN